MWKTAFKNFETIWSASAIFLKADFHKFYLMHSWILCSKCQVEDKEKRQTKEKMHPNTNLETPETQRKNVCKCNMTFSMKKYVQYGIFFSFQNDTL